MTTSEGKILEKKLLQGGFWLISLRISSRFLGFIRSIILARLLTPADFGLVGIAMLVLAVLDIVTQTGFDALLIHRKNPSTSLIDTAWSLQALRGVFLFVLAFAIAPWAAQFFHLSALEMIIRVIAVSLVVTGVRNIGMVFFQKELRFDQTFKFESLSSFIDLIVSVTLAFVLRDVWALVWGGLAGNISRLLLSYIIHPYRPHFNLQWENIKSIVTFGKWVTGVGIVYSIQIQVDTFTIGKVLGAKEVGFYQMALTVSALITTEISYLLKQLTFPSYSMLQDNLPQLKNTYLEIYKLMALILLPLVGILFFLAEEIVGILLGDQWLPSVTCLKLLTIAGALATFGRLAYPVFLALGRPKYETLIQLASLFCLVIFIYPLTKEFGINGAAGALCLSNIVVWYLSLSTSFRVISCTKKAQLKPIVLSFIATSIMGGVIIMEKKFLGSLGKIWFLMISLPTGLLVYMGVLYCMEKKTGYFIMRPFFERLRQAWKELPPWFPL